MSKPNAEQQAMLLKLAENMRDHPEEWSFGLDCLGPTLCRGKITVRTHRGIYGPCKPGDEMYGLKGSVSIDGDHWGPSHQGPSQDLFREVVDRTIDFLRQREEGERQRRLTGILAEEFHRSGAARFIWGLACGIIASLVVWAFA